MVETLTGSYYMESFPVAVHMGDASYLDVESHEELNEEVYIERSDTDVAAVWKDAPLVMKLGTEHLLVHPHGEVPDGTLAIPERASHAIDMESTEQSVCIAKAERAEQLISLMRGELS